MGSMLLLGRSCKTQNVRYGLDSQRVRNFIARWKTSTVYNRSGTVGKAELKAIL